MICHDTTIKDLLPLYAEEALDEAGKKKAEQHLASCLDCRQELDLLRALAAETVPDPGEAFWTAMPGRVFQAVKEQQSKKTFGLSRLADLLLLPRWAWATAAAAVVLVVAWLVIGPFRPGDAPELQEVYDVGYASLHDPVLTHPSVNMTDLSDSQLETVNSWAGEELAAMASEAESAAPLTDRDISEEMAELSGPEIQKLSTMLNDYSESEEG